MQPVLAVLLEVEVLEVEVMLVDVSVTVVPDPHFRNSAINNCHVGMVSTKKVGFGFGVYKG